VDANTGWVVGGFSDAFGQSGRIILHTTDGGSNWETQLYEGYYTVLGAVSFVDDQNGWTVSTSSNLLHTVDAGLTWMDANPGQGNFFRDVNFVDSLHGWIADSYSGQVLRTEDGGNSWQAIDIQQPIYIEALHFNDVHTGWLAGGDNYTGAILNTTDGGQTWQEQYTGDLILFGIDFVDAFHGWAVGWDGIILHTETGGG
jgi:photosystem II stability/assembly factor-like uncharacterized protein